jgi:hypothetical protein
MVTSLGKGLEFKGGAARGVGLDEREPAVELSEALRLVEADVPVRLVRRGLNDWGFFRSLVGQAPSRSEGERQEKVRYEWGVALDALDRNEGAFALPPVRFREDDRPL